MEGELRAAYLEIIRSMSGGYLQGTYLGGSLLCVSGVLAACFRDLNVCPGVLAA